MQKLTLFLCLFFLFSTKFDWQKGWMSCLIAAFLQQALIQQAQFIMIFLLGEFDINEKKNHLSRRFYNSIVRAVSFLLQVQTWWADSGVFKWGIPRSTLFLWGFPLCGAPECDSLYILSALCHPTLWEFHLSLHAPGNYINTMFHPCGCGNIWVLCEVLITFNKLGQWWISGYFFWVSEWMVLSLNPRGVTVVLKIQFNFKWY